MFDVFTVHKLYDFFFPAMTPTKELAMRTVIAFRRTHMIYMHYLGNERPQHRSAYRYPY